MGILSIRFPWLTLSLSLMTVLIYGVFGPVPLPLVFHWQSIIEGHIWQLFSAHFVHSDLSHLLWNMAGLCILGIILEKHKRLHLVAALTAGIISVDLYLVLVHDSVSYYAGLSGMLNSLLVVWLWRLWEQQKHPLIAGIVVLVMAKIIIELLNQQAIFTQTMWPSLPGAHMAGFLGGTIYCLVIHLSDRYKRASNRRHCRDWRPLNQIARILPAPTDYR